MSFLLMIFLTVVCLRNGYPEPAWKESPGLSVLLTAAAVLGVGLHAWWVSWRCSRSLARDPARRERTLARYERGRSVHQLVQMGAFVVMLAVLGWGWVVCRSWGPTNDNPHALPGKEVVTLLPFLLSLV